MLEAVGLEALQDVAHAVRLELEQAAGPARGEQLVGLRVVERAARSGSMRVARLGLDHLHAVVDEGERAQAQEVHLQEADALDALHVELGRDVAPCCP